MTKAAEEEMIVAGALGLNLRARHTGRSAIMRHTHNDRVAASIVLHVNIFVPIKLHICDV